MLYKVWDVQSPKSGYAVAFAMGITEIGMSPELACVRPNINAEYVVCKRSGAFNSFIAIYLRHIAWLDSDIM